MTWHHWHGHWHLHLHWWTSTTAHWWHSRWELAHHHWVALEGHFPSLELLLGLVLHHLDLLILDHLFVHVHDALGRTLGALEVDEGSSSCSSHNLLYVLLVEVGVARIN